MDTKNLKILFIPVSYKHPCRNNGSPIWITPPLDIFQFGVYGSKKMRAEKAVERIQVNVRVDGDLIRLL